MEVLLGFGSGVVEDTLAVLVRRLAAEELTVPRMSSEVGISSGLRQTKRDSDNEVKEERLRAAPLFY